MNSWRDACDHMVVHADAIQNWELRLSEEAASLIFDLRELGLQWRDYLRDMLDDPALEGCDNYANSK